MLRTRVLTAVALLSVLAGAAWLGRPALLAVLCVLYGALLFEWLRLCPVPTVLAWGVGIAGGIGVFVTDLAGLQPGTPLLMGACAVACLVWVAIGAMLVRAQIAGVQLPRALLIVSACLLSASAWFAMVDAMSRGLAWTLSILALVWLADIAAYFAGRAFGVRKLASRISPGKTWAGVWGALLAVVLVCELLRWAWPDTVIWSTLLLRQAPVAGVLLIAAFVALSIVGDLFESLVKRQAGVKDSGVLLPGHGGVWDRLDATLPALPLAVLGQWTLSNGWLHG